MQWLILPKSGIEIRHKFALSFSSYGFVAKRFVVHFELKKISASIDSNFAYTLNKHSVLFFHSMQGAPTRYGNKCLCINVSWVR